MPAGKFKLAFLILKDCSVIGSKEAIAGEAMLLVIKLFASCMSGTVFTLKPF